MSETPDDVVDRVELRTITFDDEHIEPILAGAKTVTIRHGPGVFDPYERVRLVDVDGETFATARIAEFMVLPASHLVGDFGERLSFTGHRQYSTWGSFERSFGKYYPDVDLEPGTQIKVIVFSIDNRPVLYDDDRLGVRGRPPSAADSVEGDRRE